MTLPGTNEAPQLTCIHPMLSITNKEMSGRERPRRLGAEAREALGQGGVGGVQHVQLHRQARRGDGVAGHRGGGAQA